MNQNETQPKDLGNEVMKKVGELREATENLKREKASDAVSTEDVGDWITTIGKAILRIFK